MLKILVLKNSQKSVLKNFTVKNISVKNEPPFLKAKMLEQVFQPNFNP